MKNRFTQIAIHVFGCLTFLSLPYLLASDGLSKLQALRYNPHEQRNAVSYSLTIVFFYVNYFWLIPRLFFTKKYVLYVIGALICFLLIESTLVFINQQNGMGFPQGPPPEWHSPDGNFAGRPPEGRFDRPPAMNGPAPDTYRRNFGRRSRDVPGLPSEFSQTFVLMLAGLLMAFAIRMNNRWREAEREKLQTELAYLKAQINPHFLFNTLNSIYSLAIIESPPAADAIVKLSSFLRYVIQESQKDRVALASELDYIGHYVALQKLRVDESVQIVYTVVGVPNGKQIAPLLLISFIENAFKYGVSPEEPSAIQIRITLTDNELHCHVFNKKVRVFQPMAVASGIGLTNTRARLNLLYTDRHTLVVTDKPDSFTVDLSLILS